MVYSGVRSKDSGLLWGRSGKITWEGRANYFVLWLESRQAHHWGIWVTGDLLGAEVTVAKGKSVGVTIQKAERCGISVVDRPLGLTDDLEDQAR